MSRIFAGVYLRVVLTQELNYIEKRTWLTNFPSKDLQEARSTEISFTNVN